MIAWKKEHIETIDGQLMRMRIGFPTDAFWSRWRDESTKIKLKEQGYKVTVTIEKGKKIYLVTQPLEVIDKPMNLNANMKEISNPKLLKYQHEHFNQLYRAFHNGFGVIDASDTGTGKTPVAVALSKALKLKIAIICPLAVIPTWYKWCKHIGVNPIFIGNYEAFKSKGNQYGYMDTRYFPQAIISQFGSQYGLNYNFNKDIYFKTFSDATKYLMNNGFPQIRNMIKYMEHKTEKKFPRKKCREVNDFYWNLPKDTLLVFDEVHKCKGVDTQNSKMLIAAKKFKVLMLSATIAISPRDLKSIGYIAGLHQLYDFNKWTKKFSCFQNQWNGWECTDPIGSMQKVNELIFPVFGSRMRIKDIPDFPETQITAEPYQSDIEKDFNKEYHLLLERIDSLETEGALATEIFAEIIKFRQAAELLKVPLFASMARDGVENGLSVAVFVNYSETRVAIQKALKTACAIYGVNDGRTQKPNERSWHMENFQHGRERAIIVMSQAGGTGVDLHDVYGNFARMSIISPTYDVRIFKQVLGRVWRSGAKSKSLQRIVYLAGTIETAICESVNKKLDNLSAMNDGDLMESDLLKFKQK